MGVGQRRPRISRKRAAKVVAEVAAERALAVRQPALGDLATMEDLIQKHGAKPDVTEVDVKEMLLRFAYDCRTTFAEPTQLELDAIRELRATTGQKRAADNNDEVLRILREKEEAQEIPAVPVAPVALAAPEETEAELVPNLSVVPPLAERTG